MGNMKMLIIMLLVAAILFCSHQQAVVANDGHDLQDWPWPCSQWPCPPPPPPTPFSGCSDRDKDEVYWCMFKEFSIDKCCPIFKNILGTSCPCYQYAEDLDNQVLITLEAYCDVTSPCKKGAKVIKLANDDA